jgi:hypothetical protein
MQYIVIHWKNGIERVTTLEDAEKSAIKMATQTMPAHILEVLEAEPLKTRVVR